MIDLRTIRPHPKGYVTHGMSKHPAYQVWRQMRARCLQPTHKCWPDYGGRGIRVCERWAVSFEEFWRDLGGSYQPGLTLERRDNNGHYEPDNCSWQPQATQALNKRSVVWLDTPKGRMHLKQAAAAFGLKHMTLYCRLRAGWPVSRALAEPVLRRGK